MPKVFIPQPIPEVAIDRLREYAEVEVFPLSHRAISVPELEDGISRADYLFGHPHTMPLTASMIAANPKLKGIAVSHIDSGPAAERADHSGIAAAAAAGIPFLLAKTAEAPADGGYSWNGFGLNSRATADLMVAMLLNFAYRVTDADKYLRPTGFFQEQTMDLMGVGCTGKTVSLYGLGKVARQAVPTLRGLDMHILYNKRSRLSEEEEAELGVEWVADKDELIARGDYVCMLVRFEEANMKLMGEREFALMKPTAYFINVGRARLVDEEAMIRALQNHTIAGAGLDVFWDEPPVVFNARVPEALRKLDNVILSPHNGGATYDSRGAATLAIANAIVDDIIARQSSGADG